MHGAKMLLNLQLCLTEAEIRADRAPMTPRAQTHDALATANSKLPPGAQRHAFDHDDL